MRIVILNRWFSERMGYADASLAHEYSMAGHEVFLVTSNAQPYFDSPDYCDIYEKFNGPPLAECCWKPHDNYTLIRLPICAWPYKYSFRNLSATLKKIKPDIVQTFDLLAPYNIQAALFCKFHKACFFSGNHVVNSVFSPARGGMSLLRRIKWNYWMPWIGGIFYRNFCEKTMPPQLMVLKSTDAFSECRIPAMYCVNWGSTPVCFTRIRLRVPPNGGSWG